MKYKIYVTMKNNLLMHFKNNNVFLKEIHYTVNRGGKIHLFHMQFYVGFAICNINNIIDLIIYDTTSGIILFDDFIDVTNNPKYKIENILNDSLIYTNSVIEGTDGVGKTTITISLAENGIIVYDRDVENITKKMKPFIPDEERYSSIKLFLEKDKKRKLIILYMSDKKELINRIENRGNITEFDKNSLIFQEIYMDVYNKFKTYDNIYTIDCSSKTVEEIKSEVLKILALN